MNNSVPPATVPCVICNQSVAYRHATAGSLYADGSQAFACDVHITEHARWTLAWIAFEVTQYPVNESAANTAL